MLHILKALLSESYDKVVKVSSLCKVVRFYSKIFQSFWQGLIKVDRSLKQGCKTKV